MPEKKTGWINYSQQMLRELWLGAKREHRDFLAYLILMAWWEASRDPADEEPGEETVPAEIAEVAQRIREIAQG